MQSYNDRILTEKLYTISESLLDFYGDYVSVTGNMYPISSFTKKAVLLALSLSLLSAPTLQAESVVDDAVKAVVTSEKLTQDAKLVTGTLANGMRYMIRPTAEPKGRASARLYVEFGSLDETIEASGVAHFLEHLMFNGSRTYKRGELIPAFQKMGMGFGGDINAYTGQDRTVYIVEMPKTNEETVDFTLNVMRDYADGATLTEEAIDKERGVILSELKVRDSESYRTMLATFDMITKGSRIAKFLPIGTEEMITKAPYSVFRDYYKNFYTPDRMTLVVTGDFDPATMEASIKKHFDSMEARKGSPRPSRGEVNNFGEDVLVMANPESPNVSISLNVVDPHEKKDDSVTSRIEGYPLAVAHSIINRRFSRLVKEADSPILSASISKSPVMEMVDVNSLSASAKPENWQKALNMIDQEHRRALEHGFSAAEINEVLATWESAQKQRIEQWEAVSSSAMADSLLDTIESKTVSTDPNEDMRIFQLGKALVLNNPELVQKALQEEYDGNRIKISLTGTLPEGVDKDALRKALKQSQQVAVAAPEKQEVKTFAYSEVGKAGTVVEKALIEDLGVTTLTLSNGVKVNLKPLDSVKGSISVQAAVDGGSLVIDKAGKPGLAWLIGAAMGQGGLEAHSNDDLRQILAGKRVGRSFDAGFDRFIFSGSSSKEDIELQCQLLIASILHPGFRKESLDLFQRGLPMVFTSLKTTETGAFQQQGMPLIYGNDPRFTIPTEEQMKSLTLEEAKATIMPSLQKGAIEVTIVGDFKVEEIIPVLERSFAAMPQRATEFTAVTDEQRDVNFQPWKQRHTLKYDSDLDKTLVAHVRPIGDGRDLRRNRRLNVLNAILREKLFDGIRQNLGETYSPSVSLNVSSNYDGAAMLMSSSAGVVGNMELVSSAMDSILSGMAQDGSITKEDFDRAILPIVNRIDKNLRSGGYWTSNLTKLQSDDRVLPLMRDMKSDTESITYEEIVALAKEIFSKDNATFFTVVPDGVKLPDATEDSKKKLNNELGYTVLISESTAADPAWKAVAETLLKKYAGAQLVTLKDLNACEAALRDTQARYAAIVAKPEEIDYVLVNNIHRAARKVDDDIWGDCMWGIITGYTAADAQRIASDEKPLVIKRTLSTTNIDSGRFEHSCSITDWRDYQVFEQTGYQKPKETVYEATTEEGKAMRAKGMQIKFASELAEKKPQFIVTSAHATEYNLEMPFGAGLIFSYGNDYYQLAPSQLRPYVGQALPLAMKGNLEPLKKLSEQYAATKIKADGETRVWLAAGNCLFAHVARSKDSMAITALSRYTNNQVVGYTVPSWYGDGGWGTLGTFFGNGKGTTLTEAWYLNNQFLIKKTVDLDPLLMKAEFNGSSISNSNAQQQLIMSIRDSGFPAEKMSQDAMGVVHDRDVVALLGDPMWSATLDESHAPSSLETEWLADNKLKLTAKADYKNRFAAWYPKRMNVSSINSDMPATVTNDFILLHELNLKKGESIILEFK